MKTELEQQIIALPISERIKLVQDIWDSIAAEPNAIELTDEQKAEIDRRIEDREKNPEASIPWEEVKANLLRRS